MNDLLTETINIILEPHSCSFNPDNLKTKDFMKENGTLPWTIGIV